MQQSERKKSVWESKSSG